MVAGLFGSARSVAVFAVLASLVAQARAQDEVPNAAVQYRITSEKIADVRISEESPGRFIAVIGLVEAERKALSEATGSHLGEDIEVRIADEPVLRTTIRGPMEAISIGPWMNKGLANLFARCLKQCGPKKCL
jgi:hypothetical protein